ncbi:MAG: hypothetical protein RL222_1909, partial [Bacteroidota bacterium]
KEYEYTTNTEYKLKELKKSMEADSYSPEVQQLITTLEDQVKHDKSKDLQKFKPEIKRLLEQEIVSRYTYEKGRIANSLKEDIDIKKALEVLMDNARYTSILSAKK